MVLTKQPITINQKKDARSNPFESERAALLMKPCLSYRSA